MHHFLLVIFVKLTIFSLMLAIGITLSFEKMFSLWRKPALLFRGLLAVVVLVPLVVILLLKLFNLPPEVMVALALLAASPGAPLITKRAQQAGGKFFDSASFQLTLALLAVLITPLTLAIFTTLFERLSEKVTLLEVAEQVMIVQFLPVSLGLFLKQFRAKLAEKLVKPLNLIANSLLLVLIIVAFILGMPLLFQVWGLPLVAIAIMVMLSLAIGHLLGGMEQDKRSILAISCIARNVGLAFFIAVLNDVEKQVIPTFIAYLMVGGVGGVLYSIWNKGKIQESRGNGE